MLITKYKRVRACIDKEMFALIRKKYGRIQNKISIIMKPEKMHELPTYHNPFIGRSHQIRSICSLLQEETTRLITLHGPGGVGKTRLSIKVGEEMARVFEDGAYFIPLETEKDYRQVPRHIGIRLRLKESFYDSWIDAIIDFLAEKHLLLILDNLEQVLDSVTIINRIIDNCKKVKILTTSREILGIKGEIEYALGSLNRPTPKLIPQPRDLIRFDAIRLFVQQAQFSVPDFRLNEGNAEAVVKICDLLEGLPLPIELAAARLKIFSPEVIYKKLTANNELLKTTDKDVTLRHQTIRNMVKWSYDLLESRDQFIFQKISLFRGGFTLDSLMAICPEEDPVEIVESFVNKSLIVKMKEVNLMPRFQMLKLIRDYGLEQLEKNPGRSDCYRAFTKYFMVHSEDWTLNLQDSGQTKLIPLIEAEYQNIVVALEWLITNEPGGAARLGVSFWRFYLHRGFLREGLSLIETLLSLKIEDHVTRAKLFEGAGTLSHNLGNYLKAKEYFEYALELNILLQNEALIAKTLNNLSWVEWRLGNYQLTVTYAERALELFLKLDDAPGQAKSKNNLAWTAHCRGLFEEAAILQRQILDIYMKANRKQDMAFAKVCLAKVLLKLGETDEAERLILKGIEQFRDLRNEQLEVFSYLIMSELAMETRNYASAKEILLNRCLTGFNKIGDSWGIATSHYNLGEILFRENLHEQAMLHWDRALEMYSTSSDKFGEAIVCLGISKYHFSRKNMSIAEYILKKGLAIATQLEAHELLKNGYFQKACQVRQKSIIKAFRFLNKAKHHAIKQGAYQYHKFQLSVSNHFNSLPSEQELRSGLNIEPFIRRQASYTEENPFLLKVRKIVETNLNNSGFSVKDFCMEVGISHSQLHRRLHEMTGQSISEFIRSIKLDKARQLLLNQNLTVAFVAYETGYKDPDYFCRIFRKVFRMTPTAYRKLTQNTINPDL